MNFNKLRLKWKIFAFLLGFCALLLLILWLFQTVLLDTFYKKTRVIEIDRYADIVTNYLGKDDLAGIVSGLSENNDITVDVTDMNGKSILRTSTTPQDRFLTELNKSLISRAKDNNGEFFQYSAMAASNPRYGGSPGSRSAMQSLMYVKLQTALGGVAVIINAVISPVNATVTTLRHQLYFISCIMLALSVLLAIVIAKRVSRPIEEINRGAMALAKGKYDTRFAGKGFYEIVELSETLNTAAADLGKVENLRRELLANVSHDLRTPLSLIYSYAEMMNDFPGEITPEQAKVIMDETRRLSILVNDVLDISKLESDMERLCAARFNLTENILETTKRIEELLKSDGYQISFSSDADVDVYVNADETKINRAFYNLLVNAVNYSGDSRIISVTQAVSGDRVRISVTDGGEGIAEEELPLIWDRYYKSGKSHKRGVTGTGLGLSIVKRIIELHGGSYGVQSEFGKGSTFWFELDYLRGD